MKYIIFVNTMVHDAMITYEEYEKKNNNEDEDDVKLPTPWIVIVIVLCSLAGIYIVFEAILGF